MPMHYHLMKTLNLIASKQIYNLIQRINTQHNCTRNLINKFIILAVMGHVQWLQDSDTDW